MPSPAVSITRPRAAIVTRQQMGGLKAQAISRGAHRTCMAAGRAGACARCLVIVDQIIDSKRARPGSE
jgi:hypothetical protein